MKILLVPREVECVLRKTRVWNSGLISGLERCQTQLEDELEVKIERLKKLQGPIHKNFLNLYLSINERKISAFFS